MNLFQPQHGSAKRPFNNRKRTEGRDRLQVVVYYSYYDKHGNLLDVQPTEKLSAYAVALKKQSKGTTIYRKVKYIMHERPAPILE